jgi:hypothetical protein
MCRQGCEGAAAEEVQMDQGWVAAEAVVEVEEAARRSEVENAEWRVVLEEAAGRIELEESAGGVMFEVNELEDLQGREVAANEELNQGGDAVEALLILEAGQAGAEEVEMGQGSAVSEEEEVVLEAGLGGADVPEELEVEAVQGGVEEPEVLVMIVEARVGLRLRAVRVGQLCGPYQMIRVAILNNRANRKKEWYALQSF